MNEANVHQEKKRLENPPSNINIKIQRREKLGASEYWETFEIPYRRNLNVISVLMEIRKNPVTKDGKTTTPPVWDMSCLEQVCGICTMVIDGKVRQSCSALVDDLLLASGSNTVTLAPMSKFPNVRPGPAMSNEQAQERYAYSRCMTCGCCLEACPQYHDDNYIGPQAIAQAKLFNMHPTGKMNIEDRLNGLMDDDGITNCGNAQNCIQVCPMSIPLTRAIYETNRDITVNALFGWLRK
jgi:succinate dehydrogenase / fumarate reductase, iron-sulfur subunit